MGPKAKEPICSGCKQKGHKYPDCPQHPKNQKHADEGSVGTQSNVDEIAAEVKMLSLAKPDDKLQANCFKIEE